MMRVGSEPKPEDLLDQEEITEEEADDDTVTGEEAAPEEEGPEGEQEGSDLVGERVTLAGWKADVDKDERLSAAELRGFAFAAQAQQRKAVASEAFARKDADKDKLLSFTEVWAEESVASGGVSGSGSGIDAFQAYEKAKFAAADQSPQDGFLSQEEYENFVHPELSPELLEVEATFQIGWLDRNGDGILELAEFASESRKAEDPDFSYEDAVADFHMHDHDSSGGLSQSEFQDLLKGHILIEHHIEKAIRSADDDADGHIHLQKELLGHLEEILDNEFIEDYFLHPHHDEL